MVQIQQVDAQIRIVDQMMCSQPKRRERPKITLKKFIKRDLLVSNILLKMTNDRIQRRRVIHVTDPKNFDLV